MQRNLKVLVVCLWVLCVAGASFWLANHRDRREGGTAFTQPGAILKVFDRRGDGYGEVLVLFSGGDSYEIRLLRYSPKGLVPTTIAMGDGC